MRLVCPEVRDLACVMSAPSLLAVDGVVTDAECAAWLKAAEPRLLELDRDPAPLLEWLARFAASPLLGKYFEALVGFWVSELMGGRRLAQGVRVVGSGRDGREGQVVGELDFVFELNGRLEHWETSVKFYLCTGDPKRAMSFWGTMTRDRLDKKMGRILGRQLGMASAPEGREALKAAGFEGEVMRSRAFFKGALFYPAGQEVNAWPPAVPETHLRGWWSRELPAGERWIVLDRRRWLSPYLGAESLTREALQARLGAHFAEDRTAVMVATVGLQDGSWAETSRGLVVHPGWPWPVHEQAVAPVSGPVREGVDYTVDASGRWVFTRGYHLRRGYCCGSGCRHCPY